VLSCTADQRIANEQPGTASLSGWISIIGLVLLYFEEEPGRWSHWLRHVDKPKHLRWFAKGLDHRCMHRRFPPLAQWRPESTETRALREDRW
jgi:hypothetical protein